MRYGAAGLLIAAVVGASGCRAGRGSGCEEAKEAYRRQEKVTIVAQQAWREAQRERSQAEAVAGQTSLLDPGHFDVLRHRNDAQHREAEAESKARDETRLFARLVVDNGQCFSPEERAASREYLARTQPR